MQTESITSLSTSNKNSVSQTRRLRSRQIREMCIFAVLGTLMFCSKILMEILPNIHLLGMFTMVYTVAYRRKALIPIYIYVFLNGIYAGFSTWWVPYLYVWTILWAITMLIPKSIPKKVACFVYPLVCGLHGCVFGVLYAPAQAWMFGLNFEQTVAWIVSGLPFDLIHGVGNLVMGVLILPLSELLKKQSKRMP